VTGTRAGRGGVAGFTLLEMLVVMVIASLMIALVPPMFSGAVSGTRIKGSARDLAITLRESRSRAIIYNIEQRVHLDMENQRYRVGDGEATALPEGVSIDIELITLRGGKHVWQLHLNWLTGNITINVGDSDAG
jgi:general secretion pathway protein H